MSIVTEIERIKTNIANAYTKCEEKGATMPSVLNSANLVECIGSITGGGSVAKQLIYQGATTPLSVARQNNDSGNVGEYGLLCIGGNGGNSNYYSNIDAYKSDLTKPTNPSLSFKSQVGRVANTTDYLLASGGYNGSSIVATVNSFDSSLVRGTPASLSESKQAHTGVGFNGKALFAGGKQSDTKILSSVDCYDNDLVKTTLTALSAARAWAGGGTIGDFALVAGGINGSNYYDTVDTYNSSLAKGTTTSLTVASGGSQAVRCGNKLLIAGGKSNSNGAYTDIADVYTETLVKETPTTLSVGKNQFGGAELKGHAVFCCGQLTANTYDDTVDMFNPHLVRTTTKTYFKKSMTQPVAVGNYLLSGGGYNGASQSAVEVFELV